MWYNRGDAMKREVMCTDWLRVCMFVSLTVHCHAYVAVLMSLSWWLMALPFGRAHDLGKIIVEFSLNFIAEKF